MTTNSIMTKAHEASSEAHGAARGGLEANSQAAWPAVADTMTAVTPAIRGMLFPAGLGCDVEDVAQDALISAVTGAQGWDPARGPLVAWVTQVGKRRAIDHLRCVTRRNEAAVFLTGQTDEDEAMPEFDLSEASFEDRPLDRVDAWGIGAAVLGQVKIVMRNDETMRRALMVLAECDGGPAASDGFGVGRDLPGSEGDGAVEGRGAGRPDGQDSAHEAGRTAVRHGPRHDVLIGSSECAEGVRM